MINYLRLWFLLHQFECIKQLANFWTSWNVFRRTDSQCKRIHYPRTGQATLVNYSVNQQCHPNLRHRKTTADGVVEGHESECRADFCITAKMSNQMLLWASSTDQAQCNQALRLLRVTFSLSHLLTWVFCPRRSRLNGFDSNAALVFFFFLWCD